MKDKISSFLILLIVAISAVIVFAAISHKIAQKREQILCRNNLRHFGTAFQLYATRYEKFPTGSQWRQKILPLLFSNDIACPTAQSGCLGYKLNDHAHQSHPQMVLLFDSLCDDADTAAKPRQAVSLRHLGGANLLLVDGSAWYCPAAEIDNYSWLGHVPRNDEVQKEKQQQNSQK